MEVDDSLFIQDYFQVNRACADGNRAQGLGHLLV